MSDPSQENKQKQQPDELELDAETVEDLEVDDDTADAVRGGPGASGHAGCLAGL